MSSHSLVSGAILSNTLSSRLAGLPFVSSDLLKSLTSSTYGLDELNLSKEQTDVVLGAYMDGLRYIFILYAASAGSNFLMCVGIGNTNLRARPKPEDKPSEQDRDESEAVQEDQVDREEQHGDVEKRAAGADLEEQKSSKHEA